MWRWLRALDETKDQDIAAFLAGSGFSLVRIGVGVIVFSPWLMLTLVLCAYVGPFGFVGFPGSLLLAELFLAHSPSGRGALWTFGKGRSPSQSILGLTAVSVLVAAGVGLLYWHWASVRRP
jgi:hypothetical protein